MANGRLMTQEEYLAEEAREERMQQEFEEWGTDDFSFPWLDCISTCNFSNPAFLKEFPKAIDKPRPRYSVPLAKGAKRC